MIVTTPYAFLHTFCCTEAGRNEHSSAYGSKELTNRAKTICEILKLHDIPFEVDQFEARSKDDEPAYYFNIEVFFKASANSNETIMYTAHHDIANPRSENCQDNTASVVNLIDLCDRIKDKKLSKNVAVVFTDCEECGGLGAQRLSDRILDSQFGLVTDVVNSELTALGGAIWMEKAGVVSSTLAGKLSGHEFTVKGCPFNDSIVLRRNGINSVCFGILPEDEVNNQMYGVPTWALCHSENDVYDNSDQEDMSKYVDFLVSLI